ncbi:MAG: MaoC family dehydratase [Bosea sp. (in: a-proteobacteria)]
MTQAGLSSVKTNAGRFFEDFAIDDVIVHATPRTISEGDIALYTALYGPRFAPQSSKAFALGIGFPAQPVDELIVFHTVFGKTVPDISLNAVANLGYADGRFLQPVYAGDTLATTSIVIGLKATSGGDAGIVYVHSTGQNQHGQAVLDYVRWVLVKRRTQGPWQGEELLPELPKVVEREHLSYRLPKLDMARWDMELSGSAHRWRDYEIGERIDHVDGMTVEEAEHQLATRLWQNTAKVHFDAHAAKDTRFGRRLIYGGHVISIARALSFNGLGNLAFIAAINAGRHVAPLFAGDTVYAWSEVLDMSDLPDRDDLAAIRLRLVATRNRPCADFPLRQGDAYVDGVILDLDYWGLMPV